MAYCPNPVCPSPQNSPDANFCQTCGTSLSLVGLVGRYQLQSVLGQSGFGRTFLAVDEAANCCVVKQIYGQTNSHSATQKDELKAEAERLRRLGEHPQIPRLIEAIETDLGQFLVQQFIPGDSLKTRIEADGPWTQLQVRSLLSNLISVLQYVHSFDIIHRDIKPANIVIEGKNSESLPTLVDFGAAKWVRQAPAKTVIGSASYAAPEQFIGKATFASDIYSLGLTCLYLLTSIHPFSLYSAAEDRWVWRDYLPQPIETRFAQVLDQMVEKSLQHRYESMDQVALDLQFSQDPLSYASKQLLTRAKNSVEPLKNALQLSRPAARPAVKVVNTAAQTWQRRDRITQAIGISQAIAISPRPNKSNPIFATAGTDGSIRLWHLPSTQLIHTFQRRRIIGDGHTAAVSALQFHPDGRALYSTSSDGTIKEWDSLKRCLLNTLPTAGWIPTDLLVTPDGAQLISPNSDGKIVLCDIATLMPIYELAQHQRRLNAIALSSQGDVLASASDDGTIKLWQYRPTEGPRLSKTIRTDTETSHQGWFKGPEKREGAIALAFYRPPNQRANRAVTQQLVVATTASVQIYSLDSQLNPSSSRVFYQPPYPITAFALSTNGDLAIGSEDSVVTLWQLSTGECVAQLTHDWGISAIAFSPDGQTLITASADEIITLWRKKADLP
ncbi:MAG: WD40 repeat domain-containing serine/threonine-protein kinase [Phormidesmis sp.]